MPFNTNDALADIRDAVGRDAISELEQRHGTTRIIRKNLMNSHSK